ncbi:DUF3618 domain-containing protein [Corynebacterium sanguinis]|uniref:DUF3618 domain-containing protein n=2 Tax=Corynebacterium TaxID=1716 RepID=C0XRB6_CORLD|nr:MULTISPECIES: DUF3618 domain-containing protein [Corynebacterium]EEI17250.1 hypothetical protein HMPREF0298_0986 [Corynebacterium lipophiloflavum DSM 44291]MCT1411391.1 DUF3618 domain-containing protein [Corynebacterium sanguinis]MCT1414041.1 DUF3618 domain-containing protein [Corynebacterium sanguinis]MCT1426073.1 DUF3618 domain-containing protein [Corynebacterium sanguinis]MCT1444157.1 DUF3618 domain-containing protein [Corynebacterium sanguinis]
MARDIDDIERDIERTRDQLASTLDEIAHRANPSTLADNAKDQAKNFFQDETVQKVLVGIGVGVAVLIGIKALNGRKRKKELKELQRLLARR